MIDPLIFQPLRDLVLVRDLQSLQNRLSPGGIVMVLENPELVDVVSGTTDGSHGNYARESLEVEVVAIGPGKWIHEKRKSWFKPTTLKPGDRVRCTAWNDAPDDALPAGYRLILEGDVWWKHEPETNQAKPGKARARAKAAACAS